MASEVSYVIHNGKERFVDSAILARLGLRHGQEVSRLTLSKIEHTQEEGHTTADLEWMANTNGVVLGPVCSVKIDKIEPGLRAGKPRRTEAHTAEELQRMGIWGLYR